MIIEARETKSVKTHTCHHCGRPICRNEYKTRVTFYESGKIYSIYYCCKKPSDFNCVEPKIAFRLENGEPFIPPGEYDV